MGTLELKAAVPLFERSTNLAPAILCDPGPTCLVAEGPENISGRFDDLAKLTRGAPLLVGS